MATLIEESTFLQNALGTFLPSVHVSKITLEQNRVNLQLMLIDTANKDFNEGVFSLINDEILKDCVKIKVFESISSYNTQKMLSGQIGRAHV